MTPKLTAKFGRVSALAFFIGLSMGLAGMSAQAEPIKIGTSKTGMLIWLADALGYLDGAGVELEEVGSGVVAANRVADGSLSFGTSSDFAFTSKIMDDPSMCVYATISASRTTRLISRSDKIGPAASDLAGTRIAVTANGIGQYFLSQFLILSEVDENTVELVNAKPDDIVTLIVDGKVDAAMTWEPHVTRIRDALGDLAVDYIDQADQYYYFVLHGKCALTPDAEGALVRFLDGLRQADEFASSNPEDARSTLAQRLDLAPDAVASIWPQHSLALTLSQDLISAIESEAEWRIDNGVSDGPIPNVLEHVRLEPLRSAAPDSVRIIN